MGKLFGEGRGSPEDEKLMTTDKTELDYLGIRLSIKGVYYDSEQCCSEKIFLKSILNFSVRGLTKAFKYSLRCTESHYSLLG